MVGLLPEFLAAGLKVIDLSGDFRLKDGEAYRQWYKHEPAPKEEVEQAVYGLCEVFGQEAADRSFISNPGCYATAAILDIDWWACAQLY